MNAVTPADGPRPDSDVIEQAVRTPNPHATPPVPVTEAVSGYTSHGHRIAGVVQTGRPASVARCGGPGLCTVCSLEAVMATNERHGR